jgi:hypothetical protein
VRAHVAHHGNDLVVVSPSPTISPDLVGTPGTRCLEFGQQLQRMM